MLQRKYKQGKENPILFGMRKQGFSEVTRKK